MAKRYQTLENGCKKLVEATVTSSGTAEAGDIVALGTDGKLDASVLPAGLGEDIKVREASEDLLAGAFINLHMVGTTALIRNADSSNGREADGFIKTAIALGESGAVFFEGGNPALTGLTPGARIYLGTAGGVTETPLDPNAATTTAGMIHQYLGKSSETGEVCVEMDDKIVL